MRSYLITITMPGGARRRLQGLYTDGCTAIIRALDLFPHARCISARRSA